MIRGRLALLVSAACAVMLAVSTGPALAVSVTPLTSINPPNSSSFDISWVDPTTGFYFLADRTNNAVDMIEAHSDTFLGYVAQGRFVGVKNCPAGVNPRVCSGPNGVVTDSQHRIWAGDGDSTIKMMQPVPLPAGSPGATTVTTIPTGGLYRADELAYDPTDQRILIANDAEGFLTFIDVNNLSVAGHFYYADNTVSKPASVAGHSTAGNGIEQPVWDPQTGLFYQAVPGNTSSTPPATGFIDVLNPTTMALAGTIPVPGCDNGPTGLALGPNQLFVGACDNGAAAISVNGSTGTVQKIVPGVGGADEVWFNSGDGTFYLARSGAGMLGSVSSDLSQVNNVPTGSGAHSVAAFAGNNHIFVPVSGSGIKVFTSPPSNVGAACVNPDGTQGCFTRIQDAVNAVVPGGTVTVAPGTYKEMVTIQKTLTLQGAGAGSTIVDATGLNNAFLIENATAVRLTGFTAQNANLEGIAVFDSTATTVSDNTVTGNDKNLNLQSHTCAGAAPFEQDDCGEGLHLRGAVASTINNNHVEHNAGGILLTDESGATHDNRVANNTVVNNIEDCGITLASHPAGFNNNVPLPGNGVYNNLVQNNTSSGNGAAGIGIFTPTPGTKAYNNTVIGNTSTNNGLPGVALHSHAPGQNLNDNHILQNTISGNGPDSDAGAPAAGIVIFGDPSAAPITGTLIANNLVSNEAIDVFVGRNNTSLEMHNNDLVGGSGTVGADNAGTGQVNAQVNYWGCPGGPGQPGCTTVQGSVNFAPPIPSPLTVNGVTPAVAAIASSSPQPSAQVTIASSSPSPSTQGTTASSSPQPSTQGTTASSSPSPSSPGTTASSSPSPSTQGTTASSSPQPSSQGATASSSPSGQGSTTSA